MPTDLGDLDAIKVKEKVFILPGQVGRLCGRVGQIVT